MRRVILNSQTTHALGLDRRVLKSTEDGTRSSNLRGLRLFLGTLGRSMPAPLGPANPPVERVSRRGLDARTIRFGRLRTAAVLATTARDIGVPQCQPELSEVGPGIQVA